jgi:hypothetical protein
MLAHVADEVEEEVVFHPVVVVDYFGTVGGVVEVEELGELLADALHVVVDLFGSEEFAFLGLERGVADHAGGTAHQCERFVSSDLEVFEEHDADKMANVERVGGGVDADIGGGDFFGKLFFGAGHDVVNHATPLEFLDKVCIHEGDCFIL